MFNSEIINLNSNHILKIGDTMVKMYGNKIVKLEFVYDENGEDLKSIISKTFKEELYKKKILLGGTLNELQKSKNDDIMQS